MLSQKIVIKSNIYSSSSELWGLLDLLPILGESAVLVDRFSGKEIAVKDVDGFLKTRKRKSTGFSFSVGDSGVDFICIYADGAEISYFILRNLVLSIEQGEQILSALISDEALINSWLYDCEYDYWQNAVDLLLYKNSGRDYSSLPLRSNGLSPPNDRMVIDNSDFPGRWRFGKGFLESVGSTMWLTQTFFDLAGTDVDRLDSLAIDRRVVGERVYRYQFFEEVFRSDGGAEARLQREVRSALFSGASR